MEAIVLAGGLGTRLRSVVSELPKPMAPIGDKPFLVYLLEYLYKHKVTRVILSVGYKWETIRDYFGSHYKTMELVYSVEEEPLGTGGAIKKAMSQVNNEKVYIVNGDTFFNVDLHSLVLDKHSKLLLSLKYMEKFDRYGCVKSNKEHKVTAFTEKSYQDKGTINGGIYLASKAIFDTYDLPQIFSFEVFMQDHLQSLSITSKVFENYFIDIGIPEDYECVQRDLVKFI